jgi:hypothetical protein
MNHPPLITRRALALGAAASSLAAPFGTRGAGHQVTR